MADLTVYHSNTHNLEHRSQSEERVKGIGKESRALYVDLTAQGTVDEKDTDEPQAEDQPGLCPDGR